MQTPQRKTEYQKQYYSKNKETISARAKEYYLNNKPKISHEDRKRNLKNKYNLSLDEYKNMFDLQKGCCAICGRHQSKFKKTLSVDHDHKTGEIRKLLCGFCNTSLGIYETYKDKFEEYLNANQQT